MASKKEQQVSTSATSGDRQSRVPQPTRSPILALFVAMVVVVLPAASATAVGDAQPSKHGVANGKGFPVAGPVIWTTDEMIERAKERVAVQEEPFYGAWLKTKARADASLGRDYQPYHGPDFRQYFQTGRSASQDVRALGLAFRVTGEQRYADKAREILALWAADVDPNVGSDSPHSVGLVAGRVLSIFADGYAMVWQEMGRDERSAVEDWFQTMVEPIMASREIWKSGTVPNHEPPWLEQQYFNNHLGAQNLGLLAIGYATNDQKLIRFALKSPHNSRDLEELITGVIIMPEDFGSGRPGDLWKGDPTFTEGAPAPRAGEIYDRYRMVAGTGFHYSHIHLRFLTLQAEMAYNNEGQDWYEYVGEQGENLKLSYDFYSEFLITGDDASRTGYYEGGGVDFNMLPLYELALRQYPDSEEIRDVLESRDRVARDIETFGWTAVLTHGIDGVVPDPIDEEPEQPNEVTSWEFDIAGDAEGWTVRKAEAVVSDGALNVTVTGADPQVISDGGLYVDAETFPYLRVRLSNTTADTGAQVFFSTTDDPTFAGNIVGFNVAVGDDAYREYLIDMSSHEDWTGWIEQIRIDPVQGTSTGTVSIDSIEFATTP